MLGPENSRYGPATAPGPPTLDWYWTITKKLKLPDVLDFGTSTTYLIWFLRDLLGSGAIESENFVHVFTSAGDKFSHDAEIESVRRTRK